MSGHVQKREVRKLGLGGVDGLELEPDGEARVDRDVPSHW